MIKDILREILHKVQQNASCHQKYLKVLEKHYNETPFDEFCHHFTKCLRKVIKMDNTVRNPYVERIIDFCSKFVTEISKQDQAELISAEESDQLSCPFLSKIIEFTLNYHDEIMVQARYHSCKFIMLILQNLGNDIFLDNDICDAIQEAMLERLLDSKPTIRLQAVSTLVRLQDPLNPDCPVIKAYLNCFLDISPAVRKEVVKVIGPNALTIPKIIERIRDVDFSVRASAFGRCADIGPKPVKIVDRQSILRSGFRETNKQVKQVFFENLMPKWLTAYNGNFLKFLGAVKLDADENDLETATDLSKDVMGVFFRSNPLKDIISYLPINKDKLVPFEELTSEVVIYWSIITNYLRESEDTEDYLNDILPELTPFSNYIESVMKRKLTTKMADWEYLDYQYILLYLFDIAEKYDFSDEVGRQTFRSLIMSTLQNHKCSMKLINKITAIACQLTSCVDVFANDMCQIISDIREPMVAEQPTQQKVQNANFNVAGIKVKLNILTQEKEDAIDKNEFERAALIEKQLVELQNKLEDFSKPPETEMVRIVKDDNETACRCLDILISTMQLKSITVLHDSLRTCKDEFVLPLISNNNYENYWRVLKCLVLFSLIDKQTAEDNAKFISIPIATYRTIPNINKNALIVSVEAVPDLIRVYSAELFGSEGSISSSNQTKSRKLYRNEDLEDTNSIDQNKMTVESIIEIILDMLDDENEEIRNVAVVAVAKLIMDSFTVSPFLISRMILKWYSPLTGSSEQFPRSSKQKENEKQDMKLQQKLGVILERYAETIKGAKEVIEKAVIPTLTSIADAPKSSPLADIDVDNMLRFLAVIINTNNQPGIVNVHTNLAHSLCYKIANKPQDSSVPYLAKMLSYLDIPAEDKTALKELISAAELLLEDVIDKGPRKNVTKFMMTLKEMLQVSQCSLTTISEELNDASVKECDAVNNNVDSKSDGVETVNSDEIHISDATSPTNSVTHKTNSIATKNIESGEEINGKDSKPVSKRIQVLSNITVEKASSESQDVPEVEVFEESFESNFESGDEVSKVPKKKIKTAQKVTRTTNLRSNKNAELQQFNKQTTLRKSSRSETNSKYKKPVEISDKLSESSNSDNTNQILNEKHDDKLLEKNKSQTRSQKLLNSNKLDEVQGKNTDDLSQNSQNQNKVIKNNKKAKEKVSDSKTDTDSDNSNKNKRSARLKTKSQNIDLSIDFSKENKSKNQKNIPRNKSTKIKPNNKKLDSETDDSSNSNENIVRHKVDPAEAKSRLRNFKKQGCITGQNNNNDSETETNDSRNNDSLSRLRARHSSLNTSEDKSKSDSSQSSRKSLTDKRNKVRDNNEPNKKVETEESSLDEDNLQSLVKPKSRIPPTKLRAKRYVQNMDPEIRKSVRNLKSNTQKEVIKKSQSSDRSKNNTNNNKKVNHVENQTRNKNKENSCLSDDENTDEDCNKEATQKAAVKVNKNNQNKQTNTTSKRTLKVVTEGASNVKRKKLVEPNVIVAKEIAFTRKQKKLALKSLRSKKDDNTQKSNKTRSIKNEEDIKENAQNKNLLSIADLSNPVAESTRYRTRNSLTVDEASLNSSSGSISEQVKRKKQRGSISRNSTSEETILHTILEPSELNEYLEASPFRTPSKSTHSNSSSNLSHRSKVVISETSSDSDASTPRKSARKIKKKQFIDFV